MPTRKSRRSPPEKKKIARRAGIDLKQLRKQINDLKKKFEQYASKTGQIQAQSPEKDHATEASSEPEAAEFDGIGIGPEPVAEFAAKQEGKRERARRMVLARIAEVRSELANRRAEPDPLVERSKH
jgi:hypothetical protein